MRVCAGAAVIALLLLLLLLPLLLLLLTPAFLYACMHVCIAVWRCCYC